ncbi:MAG: lipid-A-disaccharide synthase-related protein [Candidatus Eremiobacteraeota bacterium]|nr:lipid-A-disaccharide synthase-related protein [Candidatus Eremiobacteraeota bacterium]
MRVDTQSAPADILLVSNGFGETAIATYVARAIHAQEPAARIEHFPLVGRARADTWPPVVGPQRDMPSGGLVTAWNLRNLAADVRAGLAGLTLQQLRYLKRQRFRDVVVAVGDVYCLALCLIGAGRPTVFVATAKSELVAPHSGIERAIARRAVAAFARDEPTAASLRAAGIRAQYAGNIMMDGLQASGADLGLRPGALTIAVLPGSRADAASTAAMQIGQLCAIAAILAGRGRPVQAYFSIAPSVDAQRVRDAIRQSGVELPALVEHEGVIARGRRDNLEVALVRGGFGDMLEAAEIVLGQAGTANEQAAGCGKPVIAAVQPGEAPEKMHWYRMRQKRLLGDALLVLPAQPQLFAAEVVRLIDDSQRMLHMSAVGRERMGRPGGASAVAAMALSIAARAARA